ncbi:MAG TPA: glycosyltransferase family 2 protein [Anaerolineales bacterium]|nr:glycosyltransferase family 2 protein [Anaerolineales bacterium]
MLIFSILGLCLVLLPLGYLMLQLIASIRTSPLDTLHGLLPTHSFAIAIPAHDEEAVIANTVQRLFKLHYPSNLYRIHIVADHCSDRTAEFARRAGAVVHERNEGPRSGKGAALSWLFQRILEDPKYDAVIIFDADTRVDEHFLCAMDVRLAKGEQIVQGQHIISNPGDGWFPSLTWSMFLIDNRVQNLGRTNLGWSAKNMGDSICFSADVLRRVGWGEGLADDYQIRQKYLLNGIKIAYEPTAMGFGEAVLNWTQARAQRSRWIRGVHDANRQFAGQLFVKGLKTRNFAMLDGALQAYLPSYSVLTATAAFFLILHILGFKMFNLDISQWMIMVWTALLGILFFYPILALALEKAPAKAYFVILTGPVFILWRLWLTLVSRFGKGKTTWVRTAHKGL